MNIGHSQRVLAFAILSALYLAACDSGANPSTGITGTAENIPATEKTTSEPKATADRTTETTQTFLWDEQGNSLNENDRNYLINLSSRYHNIFDGLEGKPENVTRALGFPSAKEWLDARKMTDDELLDQIDNGSVSAKVFHTDRQLEVLETLIASSGAVDITELFQASPAVRDKYQQTAIDTQVAAAGLLRFHPSPFSAYLYGATSAVTSGVNAPIVASMSVAGELGDGRSEALLKSYAASNDKADPAAVMSSYGTMRKLAGLN